MLSQHDPMPPWETRVFFFLAALCAILFVFIWLFNLSAHISLQDYYGPIAWHNHELLFAFSTAVLSAYLFNLYPIHSKRSSCLAITISLICIWLLARIMAFMDVSHELIASVDLIYLPLLCMALAYSMLQNGRFINLFFILILLLMMLANAMIHSELLLHTKGSAVAGQVMMVYLLVIFWVVSAARYTVPVFHKAYMLWAYLTLEVSCILSLVLLLQFEVTQLNGPYIAYTSLFACIVFSLYSAIHYRTEAKKEFKWIFDLAYTWLSLGLLLRFLSYFDWVATSLSIHCFTTGVIGTFSLAVMVRAMQYRLNELQQLGKLVRLSIYLLSFAVFFRAIMPIAFPNSYMSLIMISGLLWITAFGAYLASYKHNIFESSLIPLALNRNTQSRTK